MIQKKKYRAHWPFRWRPTAVDRRLPSPSTSALLGVCCCYWLTAAAVVASWPPWLSTDWRKNTWPSPPWPRRPEDGTGRWYGTDGDGWGVRVRMGFGSADRNTTTAVVFRGSRDVGARKKNLRRQGAVGIVTLVSRCRRRTERRVWPPTIGTRQAATEDIIATDNHQQRRQDVVSDIFDMIIVSVRRENIFNDIIRNWADNCTVVESS